MDRIIPSRAHRLRSPNAEIAIMVRVNPVFRIVLIL
jgi:hypothetical protein